MEAKPDSMGKMGLEGALDSPGEAAATSKQGLAVNAPTAARDQKGEGGFS